MHPGNRHPLRIKSAAVPVCIGVGLVVVFLLAPPASARPQAERLPETRVCKTADLCVTAEIAATPAARARGLMFRKTLPADRGMLFVFPRMHFWSFWMKNTLIPLDMVWLDDQHRVVYLLKAVPPCTSDPCPTYRPLQKARYTLELAAGVAEKWGLKIGDRLDFQLPRQVVELLKKQAF